MKAPRPVRPNLVLSTVLCLVCLGAAAWFGLHAWDGYAHQEALLLRDKAAANALLERHRDQIDQTRAFLLRQEDGLRDLQARLEQATLAADNAERTRDAERDKRSDASTQSTTERSALDRRLNDLRRQLPDVSFNDDGSLLRTPGGWFSTVCEYVGDLINAFADKCFKARKASEDLQAMHRTWTEAQRRLDDANATYQQAQRQLDALTLQVRDLSRDKERRALLQQDALRKLDALQKTTLAYEEDARQAALRTANVWLVWHDLALAFCALAGALIAALRARQLDVDKRSFKLPPLRAAPPPANPPPDDAPHPTLTLDKNQLTVTLQTGERLYAVPSLLNSAHASQRLIPPFLLGAPVARALTGRLRLALITADDDPATFVGPSTTGAFHTLLLTSQQRVLLNASALAALVLPPHAEQRGFRLVTRWRSLQHAAYWFTGRLLPTEVVGPAALILYAERLAPPSTPTALPTQLIAWSPDADLHLIPRRPTTAYEQLRTAILFDNVITLPPNEPHTLLSHVNTQSPLHQPLAFLLRHLLLGILIVALVVWAISLVSKNANGA